MEKELARLFIERVKLESSFHKFLKKDLIYQLIDTFKNDYSKKQYSKNIKNPLEMALQFYKSYNEQYYNMIMRAINENKIIISSNNEKSFADIETNKVFIKFFGNDLDLFILVHEFAHFIGRNSNPKIIPNEYHFLCEVFSFYMEKKLEAWLNNKEHGNLIETRRNNRIYFESRMLHAIEYAMFCEEFYKKNGKIELDDLDDAKVKSIMSYDYDLSVGFINYLLRYPLANLLSDYLIYDQAVTNDADIYKICLHANLYDILTNFETEKKFNR